MSRPSRASEANGRGDAPTLFDVVRLDTAIRRWPAGTEGTLIEELGDHGLVEIHGETVLVPYEAMSTAAPADANFY